jgi:signal transduction histidine kinase
MAIRPERARDVKRSLLEWLRRIRRRRTDEHVRTVLQLRASEARLRAEQEHREAEASKFEAVLEARVQERTRIARDLHDTLLQSFQGLLLQFESVLTMLPTRPDEARTRLVRALDSATVALIEARDAVEGLRSGASGDRDLIDAIRSVAEEFAGVTGQPTAFSIEVVGARRGKNPLVREEVARIAGEALRNAFRHAHARRVGVRITYGEERFHLEVRDDGIGMNPSEALRPKPGHFGLRNMRERAEAIDGDLHVTSSAGSGTMIELRVPALVAYASTAPSPTAR